MPRKRVGAPVPNVPSENGFAVKIATDEMAITIPAATDENDGWMVRGRYDVQGMEEPVYRAIDKVYRGLRAKNAVLPSGRPIERHTDAVKWILYQIAEAINSGKKQA